MTRFLFERQQLPDGSMPRNSLHQRQARARQLQHPARRVRLPAGDGAGRRADRQRLLQGPHQAGRELRGHATGPSFGPERWEEQDGFSPSTISAEIAGLLAAAIIADRNGDHASARVWRGVADEFQRNLKTWTLTTNGPLSAAAVLHPPVQDRRPERGDHLRRRQRRPDARPARGHRRRLPRVRAARPAVGRRRRHRRARWTSSTRRSSAAPPAATASSATTATATATARPTATRGRRRNTGQRPPVAGARRRARPVRGRPRARPAPRSRAWTRCATMSSGVGLIPEQAWELPDLAALAVRDRPDDRLDRLPQRQAGRLGLRADVVGRPVRAPDARRRPRAACSTARPTRSTATSRHTQGQTPLTRDRAGRPHRRSTTPSTVTGTSAPGNTSSWRATNTDTSFATTHASTTVGRSGAFSLDHPAHRRDVGAQHRRHQPVGRHGARRAHGRLRPRAGHADLRRRRSRRRRQRPGQLRLSDGGNFKRRRLRPPALRGLRRGRPDIIFRVAHPRPDADVRQPARRAARRRLRPRPGRGPTSTAASFPQRNYAIAPGGAWSRAARGPGLRPAVRRRRRRRTLGTIDHPRQRDLALHHVQRAEGAPRHAGVGLGLHGRAHRPGRLQLRPGARLPADAAGLPVRRLRDRRSSDPHCTRRPEHGAQGDGRPDARPAPRSPTSSTTRSTTR